MEPKFDNFAEPPGVFIREEIEARGWSQRDLAFILGKSEQTVTTLLNGKSGISAEMAKALAEAFGTSAELWAGIQKEWELRKAGEPDPTIKSRALLQGAFPVREMIGRGWIQKTEQSVMELQFMRFFEKNNLEEVPYIEFFGAAKKTNDLNHKSQELAWLYRVRQIAKEMKVPDYNQDLLESSLVKLRKLMHDPKDVYSVPQILEQAGVRFLIVEKLTGCEIDGVCTWLDDSTPVIGMTTRHNRWDNFWFVLRHEIEHVLQGHGKNGFGILDNLMGENGSDSANIAEEELMANKASLGFGVPRNKLMSFYDRKAPYISERDVLGFSGICEVHPAIVVGQIQFLKDDYRWLKKYQVKYRDFILANSVFDGFGQVYDASL